VRQVGHLPLIVCIVHSSILKTETGVSAKLVPIYQNALRHVPEIRKVNIHCR